MQPDLPRVSENPFATRWVRPGAIPFQFPPELSAAALVDRLSGSNWWGEIVGKHGAGKSTLLQALLPALEAAGRLPVLVALHDGQRRLPLSRAEVGNWNSRTQVIVDGFEQLSLLGTYAVKRWCRRAQAGLLVTAHASVGLPRLYNVEPQLATVHKLVDHLQQTSLVQIRTEDTARCFEARQGDVRETLFDLYDLYERRTRQLNVQGAGRHNR